MGVIKEFRALICYMQLAFIFYGSYVLVVCAYVSVAEQEFPKRSLPRASLNNALLRIVEIRERRGKVVVLPAPNVIGTSC